MAAQRFREADHRKPRIKKSRSLNPVGIFCAHMQHRPSLSIAGGGAFCCSGACSVATFWQHFLENDVIFVISINIGNSCKPLKIKEKPPFLAAFNPWRCGESNPGPMTEPSVFYVRSLLAVRRFFCPHRCRRQLMASISTVKVPCRPCGSAGKASLLNDAQHPPKDEGE